MTAEKYIKLGRLTALVSFLLGTGIFGIYYLTSSAELLFVGYGFIALTGLVNIGILISIAVKAFQDNDNRKKLFSTCGLMLLNIPVMLFYCWIAIILIGVMRITFTNSMQTTLTDINIIGCETKHIDKLETGESKTVWVGITGDCTIKVDYLLNGQRKQENVVGYVTSGMGQKMKHKIGGQNDNGI
jgi:hypothetical protein